MGWTPILIALLLIVNGFVTITNVWIDDPIYFNIDYSYDAFSIMFFLEQCSFYLAMWLFGAMILETALYVERLILQGYEGS